MGKTEDRLEEKTWKEIEREFPGDPRGVKKLIQGWKHNYL